MSRNHFWISSQRLLIAISICSCANSILSLKSSFPSPAFLAPALPFSIRIHGHQSPPISALIPGAHQCGKTRSPSPFPLYGLFSLLNESLTFHTKVVNAHMFFCVTFATGQEVSDNRLLYLRCRAIKPLQHNLLSSSPTMIKISQIKILNLQAKGVWCVWFFF